MGKAWPALDIDAGGEGDLALALADDFNPTAVEEIDDRGARMRVFFATSAARDSAAAALRPHFPVSPLDVDDGDWARRSQQNLTPVTVGRITITPFADPGPSALSPQPPPVPSARPSALVRPQPPALSPVRIAIPPSMGFGTGHHATTRLCLAALQAIDLNQAFVLDVGTGSGVLAIAAARLGAARALGVDDDADAIQAANENLALNALPEAGHAVAFAVADLMTLESPPADMVTANLTGALIVRAAARLRSITRRGGLLILSGLLVDERDAVYGAFEGCERIADVQEDGWVGLTIKCP